MFYREITQFYIFNCCMICMKVKNVCQTCWNDCSARYSHVVSCVHFRDSFPQAWLRIAVDTQGSRRMFQMRLRLGHIYKCYCTLSGIYSVRNCTCMSWNKCLVFWVAYSVLERIWTELASREMHPGNSFLSCGRSGHDLKEVFVT